MGNIHKSQQRRALRVILGDGFCFIIVLLVFALFHHVLPGRQAEAVTLSTLATEQPTEPLAQQSDAVVVVVPDTPAATEAPISSPSPDPASLGDFSAAFPTADTGVNADYSYQSDTLRIAITKTTDKDNDLTYFTADVYIKNISVFQTAFAKNTFGVGVVDWPLNTAQNAGAHFAVTGDYCGARRESVVIRNGKLYRDSYFEDVFALYTNGVMATVPAGDFNVAAETEKGIYQAWSFGPALVQDGVECPSLSSASQSRQPRCAVGYYGPGHYCFIVVDGRQPGYSNGIRLTTLAKLFLSLGCKEAYNMDGGMTASMVFEGAVITQPCKGGRQSSDIIFF